MEQLDIQSLSLAETKKEHGKENDINDAQQIFCHCKSKCKRFTSMKEGPNKGREFYICPKSKNNKCGYFQWVDKITSDRGKENDITDAQQIFCHCKSKCKRLTTMKEGPNKGREFYTCPKSQNNKCGYFQWVDQMAKENKPDDGEEVFCHCEMKCKRLTTTKEGSNKGREFYVCPKPKDKQCGYFHWVGEPAPVARVQEYNQYDDQVICHCGMKCRRMACMKDGPNKGREFYSCSSSGGEKCNYFRWMDTMASYIENQREFGYDIYGDSDDDEPLLCNCGLNCRRAVSLKEGRNQGREFYACPKSKGKQCGFFRWITDFSCMSPDSFIQPARNKPARAANSKKGGSKKKTETADAPRKRKCGNCGEEGHNRKTCPST